VSTLPLGNFKRKEDLKLYADLYKAVSSNPLALVANDNGVVVGQLVGDGRKLTFVVPLMAGSVRVCMPIRKDIDIDPQFTVPDLASR
jgi:hypothetical protein